MSIETSFAHSIVRSSPICDLNNSGYGDQPPKCISVLGTLVMALTGTAKRRHLKTHAIHIDRSKPLAAEPRFGHNRFFPDLEPVLEVSPGEGQPDRSE